MNGGDDEKGEMEMVRREKARGNVIIQEEVGKNSKLAR